MKWLLARGWLDARTVWVVRSLVALALIASFMSFDYATGHYWMYWDEPRERAAFYRLLPELVLFAIAHGLVPLIFALIPRRITNILFWASAVYLLFPLWETLAALGRNAHALNYPMAEWFVWHGFVILGLAVYTAVQAARTGRDDDFDKVFGE